MLITANMSPPVPHTHILTHKHIYQLWSKVCVRTEEGIYLHHSDDISSNAYLVIFAHLCVLYQHIATLFWMPRWWTNLTWQIVFFSNKHLSIFLTLNCIHIFWHRILHRRHFCVVVMTTFRLTMHVPGRNCITWYTALAPIGVLVKTAIWETFLFKDNENKLSEFQMFWQILPPKCIQLHPCGHHNVTSININTEQKTYCKHKQK